GWFWGGVGPVRSARDGGRCHGLGGRAWLPLGGGGGRTRCRLAGRGLVGADPARCVPLGCADELAVCGPAVAAVRYCQWRAAAASCHHRRRTRRRAGEAAATAQILSELSTQARRQRGHAERAAGPARILPRL